MAEIIQQWQYLGKVHPKLLEDKVFENCQKVGITSLESYLYWAEIEREPGKIDFSTYDILVEKLKKHNLKWVPFLILGPDYATPEWFQKSNESVYAQCLEHKKESKIQSIWNPFLPKWVDRFLRIVSEHYQDKNVLESICLGISGNWGEAIYPATGGFYGNFHTHCGWWCSDKYARQNYLKFALQKYKTLGSINTAWGTNFSDLSEIDFPFLKQEKWREFIYWLLRKTPHFLKKWFKIIKKTFSLSQEIGFQPAKVKKAEEKQYWLDFVNWYFNSMTDWAGFWLKTARKYFPATKIYLVTGGLGHPVLGADFSAQTKKAAQYNAGIRITNHTNDYSQSFIFSRLVSTAVRFYNSYFTTEEAAIIQNARGIIMRIFDTLSSGGQGFYCKNIISIGKDPCLKKNLPVGQPNQGAISLTENLQYLKLALSAPIIKLAVFFPSTSIVFKPLTLDSLYEQCSKLRDVLDFDLLDENMIKDNALEKYQYLLVLKGEISEGEVSEKIKNWSKKGGILSSNPKIITSDIDNESDRVYATRFADKVIYYNANNFEVKKKVDSKFIKIKANSIRVEQSKLCES